MACGSCGGRKSKARMVAAYSPESIPDPLAGPDGVYRFTDDAGDCERYHGIFTGTTVFVLGLGTEHERIFLRTTKAAAERYAAEGAYQIGIDDNQIDEALDQTTEIVYADLLYDGEKVRHNSDRLAQVVLNCRKQALNIVHA